jgi:SAM-dependent methyltransferase
LRPPARGVRALIDRLRRDPVGLVLRAIQKLLLGPLRYGKGGDYAAERYWRNRLGRSAGSLRGPGHEGLSEAENARLYSEAAGVFKRACQTHQIDLRNASVLDVGCGTGEFTRLCHEEGVARYVGMDLTDVLFPALTATYPHYAFTQSDITTDRPAGPYDLVLALDVLEHVVDRDRLARALANLAAAVAKGGHLFVALPLAEGSPRPFFYLRLWSFDEVSAGLEGLVPSPPIPWRDGWLLVARRLADPGTD